MTEAYKSALVGDWASLAIEVRPSKNPDGSLKSFFLTRDFKFSSDDWFELTIVNFADAAGQTPLAKIMIRGHVFWRGAHPVAAGAQKVDFHADEAYEVTPLHVAFANVLNQVAKDGYDEWRVAHMQSIFGKAFPPFRLEAGTNFMEYDLVYLSGNMQFWGARHVDGRGFDSEDNRPTNLQIPLLRKQA